MIVQVEMPQTMEKGKPSRQTRQTPVKPADQDDYRGGEMWRDLLLYLCLTLAFIALTIHCMSHRWKPEEDNLMHEDKSVIPATAVLMRAPDGSIYKIQLEKVTIPQSKEKIGAPQNPHPHERIPATGHDQSHGAAKNIKGDLGRFFNDINTKPNLKAIQTMQSSSSSEEIQKDAEWSSTVKTGAGSDLSTQKPSNGKRLGDRGAALRKGLRRSTILP